MHTIIITAVLLSIASSYYCVQSIIDFCLLYYITINHAGMPVSQSFGAVMGPILLDNVACDQSHSELLQCVHPHDIGIHNYYNRENVAGVICPNVSITTATTSIDLLTTNTQ